jgi:hypothetical protein
VGIALGTGQSYLNAWLGRVVSQEQGAIVQARDDGVEITVRVEIREGDAMRNAF